MAAAPIIARGNPAPYPIFIESGLLLKALPRFIEQQAPSSVAVVTNETIVPLYGEALHARLPNSVLISIPDGEQYKTLDTVQTIYDKLLQHNADRSTLVVALGGGVITDIAGFAAATFMRGVRLVQAPTTLLAMVDAAIGGKVGVDLPQGKNLVGAFKDPLAVFADTATLATLPEIEIACGMAEVIKAGLIEGKELWHLLQKEEAVHNDVIRAAVRVKVNIVEEDRTEQGLRMVLNLGHTFAHALEQVSGYEIKHGYAVGIGLAGAALLSVRCGLSSPTLVDDVERMLTAYDLSLRYDTYQPETLFSAMRHDKKWRDNIKRFVLLEGIGRPLVKKNIPVDDIMAVLHSLRAEGK